MRIAPLIFAALLFAGCTTPASTPTTPPVTLIAPRPEGYVVAQATNVMSFNQSIVTPAVGLGLDLYEPLLEVSDSGAIYVAAHVAGAVSTGTPAYVSTDDGKSWRQLPFLGPAAVPSPGQGSALPSGDEGMIVAGPGGHAYMADVALHSFPVEGWCDNGATQCYHNPNAYDREAATTQPCGSAAADKVPLNDRPWAAYANGTLLLSNNAGNGAVQVGILQVPPALPGDVMPAKWNMCAGSGSFLPGIPAMRDDLQFAVPIMNNGQLDVVIGNAHSLMTTSTVTAFEVTDEGADFGGGGNWGFSGYDKEGTLFVAATNNTKDTGRFIVAASTNGGANFTVTTFETTGKIGFLNVDGNMGGPGALVSWIQDGGAAGKADVYAAHLFIDSFGQPIIRDVSVVASKVTAPCGDVMGSGSGPDGRAYVVVFSDAKGCLDTPGSHPLSVYVQGKGGAVLPILKP
ncbi:MAG: hypothetical protein V4510_03910 [bacterium]